MKSIKLNANVRPLSFPLFKERFSIIQFFILISGLVFLISSLMGISMSSIGLGSLRADPASIDTNLLAGEPRYIRGDEYARTTPWSFGVMADPSISFASPLTADHTLISQTENSGLISKLVLFQTSILQLGPYVPDTQLFSFAYLLSFWISIVGIFSWFVYSGIRPRIAVFGLIAIAFAPSTTWWSFSPLVVAGWVAASAVLFEFGFNQIVMKRKVFRGTLTLGLSALLMTRLPFMYLPWALPLAIAMGGTTLLRCWKLNKRSSSVITFSTLTLSALLFIQFLRENSNGLNALSETIYPGTRLVSGLAIDGARLFSAPVQWVLQNDPALPSFSNQSELSSGYLVLAFVSLIFISRLSRPIESKLFRGAAPISVTFLGLLAWLSVNWPVEISTQIPILNRLPPDRALVVVFILSAIIFAFAANDYLENELAPKQVAGLSFVLVFFVTAWGASQFKNLYVNDLRTIFVWLSALVFALVIAQMVWRKFDRISVAIASCYLISLGIGVNPVYQGLGDLRSSSPAKSIKEIGDSLLEGEYVASDDFRVDALLMANGVPSISGQQWVGPSQLWEDFAPGQEAFWNRGASYITFDWNSASSNPALTNPSLDVIEVSLSPCSTSLVDLNVRFVLSAVELEAICTKKIENIYFGGNEYFIYEIGN